MSCTCGASLTTFTVFTGDTIRPKASFRDYAVPPAVGALVDPDDEEATWIVYDSNETAIDNGVTEREGVGIYFYDWTVPSIEGIYYFEITGLFNTKPQLSRVKVVVKFRPGS